MPINQTAVKAYSQALAQVGIQITFQRWDGIAPNRRVAAAATVNAVIRDYAPDTTAESQIYRGAGRQGAITEGDRLIIVSGADLRAASYPLPLQKNDTVVVVSTGDSLAIIQVDPYKRAIADAIELKAVGIK